MTLTRSQQMARIRGRDTGPELLLRKTLWLRGIRYRTSWPGLGCRPDLVIPAVRLLVFVDGCFWHGCPQHYVRPRSSTVFWTAKLKENVTRDREQTHRLRRAGWRVLRFWEHEVFTEPIKAADLVEACVRSPNLPRQGMKWRVLVAAPLDRAGIIERRVLITLRTPRRVRIVRQRRHTRKW